MIQDYTVDEIVELGKKKNYSGFTAETCGSCQNKANILCVMSPHGGGDVLDMFLQSSKPDDS